METVTKRKTKIQEEYMDGNLPSKEYQELKMNLDNRSFELNRELQELSSVSSPFKEYLNKYVPLMEDLVGFYRRSSGEVKKKILGCIFSKKFHFQDGKAAAVEFTLPIQILFNASKSFDGKKKEKELKNDLLSCFAPQTGPEPVTL